jgi:hypothetical protein
MILVYCPEPLPQKPNYAAGKVREISDAVPLAVGFGRLLGGLKVVEMQTRALMLYGRIYYLDKREPCRGSHSSYASHLTRTAVTKTMIVAARI